MDRRWLDWQVRRCYPLSRKQSASFLLLLVMSASLVLAPSPYDAVVAGVVSLVLGTDYELLRWLGFERAYDWVTDGRRILEVIERNVRAKAILDDGPNRIELQQVRGDDLRGRVNTDIQLVEGLPFWVCVEASLGDGDGMRYPLRLGTAQLTRVTPLDTGADDRALFFTMTGWETTFQDSTEQQVAVACQEAIRAGSDEVEPFAVVVTTDEIYELELDEWHRLYEHLSTIYGELDT